MQDDDIPHVRVRYDGELLWAVLLNEGEHADRLRIDSEPASVLKLGDEVLGRESGFDDAKGYPVYELIVLPPIDE